ncbi:MAG: transporter, family, partial [Polaromonas sp.]|nr:transporter, family [Polaromonas sp.]
LWVGCAMSPMSSVTLLLVSQYVAASGPIGGQIAIVALPAILLMEMLGAVLATLALYRAGECSRPWTRVVRSASTGPVHES